MARHWLPAVSTLSASDRYLNGDDALENLRFPNNEKPRGGLQGPLQGTIQASTASLVASIRCACPRNMLCHSESTADLSVLIVLLLGLFSIISTAPLAPQLCAAEASITLSFFQCVRTHIGTTSHCFELPVGNPA
jgi:hypothetical protein